MASPPSLRFTHANGPQHHSPGDTVSLIVAVHRGSDPLKKGTISTVGNAQFLPNSVPIDPSANGANPEAALLEVEFKLYGRQGCYIRQLDFEVRFAYKADDDAKTQLTEKDFTMPACMWTKDFLASSVKPQHKVMYKNELLEKKTFNIHFYGKMGVGKTSLINKLVGALNLGPIDNTPQAFGASSGANQCTTEIRRVRLPKDFAFVFYDTIGKDESHYPPGMLRCCLDGTLRNGTTIERMVQIFHSLTSEQKEVLAQTASHHRADIAIMVVNSEKVMNDSPETIAELIEMYTEAKDFRPLVVINKIELLPTPDPTLRSKLAERLGISVDRIFENTNHDDPDPKEIFRRNLMGLVILKKALESCFASSMQEMLKQDEDDEMELDDGWSTMEEAMASLQVGGAPPSAPPSSAAGPHPPASAPARSEATFPVFRNGNCDYIRLETEGNSMLNNLDRVRNNFSMGPTEALYLFRKQTVPGSNDMVEVKMKTPNQMDGADMLFVG